MKRWSFLGFSLALLAFSVPTPAQSDFVNWETPHVSPLTLTPDGTLLLAVNLPDNRLEVFDVTTGTPAPVISIPVGLDPVSVRCRSNTEAWVVNHVSDTVSVVDLTTGHVVATLDTDDEPADVVFAGTPERAFVSCSQANTVLVFDPASLGTAPVQIPILGEDPRAMGVSPMGDEVYVAVFESGNRTTVVAGGIVSGGLTFPPQLVNNAGGPYGGTNPPPNSGASFDPPINGLLPPPPPVSMILRQNAAGMWMDDNGMDWTLGVSGAGASASGRPSGWTLLDHDVAVIATSDLSVSYIDNLMNINMALSVNPVSGELGVVGTEATNEIRFEPNLTGTFVRTHLALVDPAMPASPSLVDLNTHLDYSTGTVPQAMRDMTLADPRGITWTAAGDMAYVAGMGSNNVVVLDATGARVGAAPTIEVGEGPTGVALDEANDRLYVLNKFGASISVVDTITELELSQVAFFDPTPAQIQTGRRHLYDARETSGLGLTACAACHVDARIDRLAWDLGNPAGDVAPLDPNANLGGNVPGLNTGFEDYHPMKGPMLTQTLQDIIGKEPLHWRGDRTGIEDFNGAFVGLMGDDEMLTAQEMQEFEDFLATIFFPPNPFRNFDNSLSTNLPLPGHFTTGDFGPAGQPLPNGDAANGLALFAPPNFLESPFACSTCHTLPTGVGTNATLNMGVFEELPPGPDGELHHSLVSNLGTSNVTVKNSQLRNLYERTGFEMTQLENTAGFGFLHDGTIDSIARFVAEPTFDLVNDQQVADLVAFMLSFSGDTDPVGSTTDTDQPLGPPSQSTHAAVGAQLTLSAAPDMTQQALLDAMVLEANQGDVGLVAKGLVGGIPRGWAYQGGGVYQADEEGVTNTQAEVLATAGVGTELTFTVVPAGSETRIGIDRDRNGIYDYNELFPVAPTAAFSGAPLSGTAPLSVDFTDASTGSILDWAWDFGDTNMSTEENPTHVYTTPGTYTVSLTVSGPAGMDTATQVDYITVNAPVPPTASFSGAPLSGDAPLSVDFTDTSTGTISSWAWDFGDTNMSTEQNPTHVYMNPGTYTVALTVTGPAGMDTATQVDYVTVTAPPPPVADFSGTPLTGPAPLSVDFTDASTGVIMSWAWDFGDTGMSTEQNPTHEYTTPGTYTVSLTVTNSGGSDTATQVDYITVEEPAPVAAFSGTPLSGGAPLSVDFTDESTGTVTSWAWDFGDTGMSTEQNPTHEYAAPGTYTVALTVTGPSGSDTLTEVDYITVFEPPVAGFSGTPLSGIAPLDVQFTNESTGQLTSGLYDFGDGNTSTLPNPLHTYTDPGLYTVSLTVNGPGGSDTLTRVDYIDVLDASPPVAAFSGSPLSGDAPLSVDFTDASTGTITDWAWDFGDTNMSTEQNPTNVYTTPGTYTVSLTVTGPGGSDTATQVDYITVNVPPAPTAAFSGTPLSGDAPLSVDFTDASTGTISDWAWDFGDTGMSTEQNPTHVYTTPGTYTVSLTVTNAGGSDTATQVDYITVNVPPAPTAAFSGTPLSGQAPLSVDFTDLSTGTIADWAWDFGDTGMSTEQNPTHVYTTPGTYTVSLTVTNAGGSDTATQIDYITVDPPPAPTAAFSGTPLSGDAPLSVDFTDLSTGTVTDWAWDFGDTNMSTEQNPTHVYTTPGTYTVSLTVTNAGGSDTATQVDYITVDVPPAPTAAFSGTPLTGGTPLEVVFTDASTGAITDWAWDFGDTNMSTEQNPTHTYTAAGTYTVSLTVTGPGGSDTATQVDYITVIDPPVADFSGTPLSGNAPLDVQFTNESTGSFNMGVYDFGDGNTATNIPNPLHTYATPGVYTVSLTVTGPGGSDTLIRTDYVEVFDPAPPVAAFSGTPLSGDAPLSVDFTDASTGTITSWAWDFGDTNMSTEQNPTHVYTAAGTYTVSLTVTGPNGSDTATQVDYVTVNAPPAPVAAFMGSPLAGDAPLSVDFTDASTGTITSWAWDFGDTNMSTEQNPTHVYTTPGTYTVALTVTGPGGSDTLTETDYVLVNDPAPVAAFSGSPLSGDAPLSVDFTDNSTGAITSWAWDFGDTNMSTEQNPTHVYTTAGTYTVSLTVTGPGGSDTLTETDYVVVGEPAPVAAFSGSPLSGDAPLSVDFTDNSTGTITSWAWDFGDTNGSTEQNPTHVYTTAGTYTVSLTVTGPGGSDTQTETDYVVVGEPAPVASFTATPLSGDAPLSVDFTDTSTGTVTSWAWDFGDSGMSTEQNPTHLYTTPGVYTVSLTVTGPGGMSTATLVDLITVDPTRNILSEDRPPLDGGLRFLGGAFRPPHDLVVDVMSVALRGLRF